jgi:hypothetical protein
VTTPTTEDRLEGLAEVENLLQVLIKGLRAIQLYLPNNPVYQRAVENIQRAFGPVWECTDDLMLDVEETDLHWDGKPVLVQADKSESVAWVLYKDGVRQITFFPGAEEEEIVRFLQTIHQGKTLDPEAPDDLLTLLWDQDFQFIRYDHVELGMEEVPQLQRSDDVPEAKPEQVRQEVAEEPAAETPAGIVSIDDFDATMYFLDDEEIAYLKSEIEREYNQDLRGNVLAMLFDLLELQTYSTVRAELLSIIENFIPYLLAVGDFHSVALILKDNHVILERARDLLPEHRQLIQHLPAKLSEPQALGQLLQALDEAAVHPTEDELSELFRELQPRALSTVLSWIPKLSNERVRSLLYGSAQRLAQAHPDELVKALGSDDESVLIETVGMSKALKLPPLVPALGNLLRQATVPVRRDVVDALAAIGTPGAMKQLEQALNDADREVRIRTARVFGTQGYRQALQQITSAVTGRKLRDADLTEKTAFFETYGMLSGPKGLETLEPMLGVRGLFRRKEDPEIRACAAMAIGKIGTSEARQVLERAADDKEPLVRNAVSRAMQQSAS